MKTMLRWPLHLLLFLARGDEAIRRDVERCLQPRLDLPTPRAPRHSDRDRVLALPSFRSVLYFRMSGKGPAWRALARICKTFYRPETALFLSCPQVGPGLYVSHGFATILTARSIGSDCMVGQQVTVGWSNKGGPPVIGDRVRITAGAIVIGPITIGNDAVIGANALVIHDVPEGAVMGGVPAKIIGYGHIEDRSVGYVARPADAL